MIKIIPQHSISRLLGKLANARLGKLTHWAIQRFIAHYQVDLSEAIISDSSAFSSFNDFFIRQLKPEARPICREKHVVISPVDGRISEMGFIQKDQLLQAKNHYFNLKDLCGSDVSLAARFEDGAFLTAYLAPKNYHRIHMPVAGKLKKMIYVPGSLFSVNPTAVQRVSNLFSKNERVICLFETAIGDVAVIAVGAMIVGSVVMNWHGVVMPRRSRECRQWLYHHQHIILERGDELGYFRLGSTVIILFEKNTVAWLTHLKENSELKLGEKVGVLHNNR